MGVAQAHKQRFRNYLKCRNALIIHTKYRVNSENFGVYALIVKETKIKLTPRQAPSQ